LGSPLAASRPTPWREASFQHTRRYQVKLAVTSQGPDLTSEVDPRFGRAKFLVVVDTATGESATLDNAENLNALQGAGTQAAQSIVNLGVSAVVTGSVGPKAFATLNAGGVKTYIDVGASGSVSDAVAQLKACQLECVSKPNVEGHWVYGTDIKALS
jgi:predicted Fe-Mo cluster-binding NifX family protein